MKNPDLDFVYRATIILDGEFIFKCTLVSPKDKKLTQEEEDSEILNYIYQRYCDMQPDISKYKIEKLYTVKMYASIVTLASNALERSQLFPN